MEEMPGYQCYIVGLRKTELPLELGKSRDTAVKLDLPNERSPKKNGHGIYFIKL